MVQRGTAMFPRKLLLFQTCRASGTFSACTSVNKVKIFIVVEVFGLTFEVTRRGELARRLGETGW